MLLLLTTVYGVLGALSGLFQLQRMYRTASSEDMSLRFFLVYFGGYWVWLYYGIVGSDPALIVVDSVGVVISGLTIGYALYLRIVEGGQRFFDALLDRSVSARGPWALSSNSGKELEGPRPPANMKGIVYSPIYPMRRIIRDPKDPHTKEIAELGRGEEKKHFFEPVARWREIDGGATDWAGWRADLLHALSYLGERGVSAPATEVAGAELARKRNSRPSPERLAFARTVFILSVAIERQKAYPRDEVLQGVIQQINHPRGIRATEQRWLEQLLGTFYIQGKAEARPKRFLEIQKRLPREIKRVGRAFVVRGAWEDLLWPVQAGINDYWGSPRALRHPILKASWATKRNDVSYLSAVLLLARQSTNAYRRHFFTHPLDYSLQNGWQALLIEDVLGKLPWYFPIEKTFLVALAQTAGAKDRAEAEELVGSCDLASTSLELSRLSGIGLDTIVGIYEKNYKKVARSCLPFGDSLDEARATETWLKYLR